MSEENLETFLTNDASREKAFPVLKKQCFLAHAAVSIIPQVAAQALKDFADFATEEQQETMGIMKQLEACRKEAAQLIEAESGEIALLGPTALGLNLVANGLEWEAGDEVVFYQDDYPANVYPWQNLEKKGVNLVPLQLEKPGRITWDSIEAHLSEKTKLVALASAHFLTGYRIDIDEIGKKLQERNILFCLDGIQTIGAFPVSVKYVDFLSADSHKWMLGPMGAGIFYVKKKNFDRLKPTLLGSWNVVSPQFIAQEKIDYYEGGRRYEPGSLNIPGILAMKASLELIQSYGIEAISKQILRLKRHLTTQLEQMGYKPLLGLEEEEKWFSGIMTFRVPSKHGEILPERLADSKVSVSFRHNREGEKLLRVSPHFYNTEEDLEKLISVCKKLDHVN